MQNNKKNVNSSINKIYKSLLLPSSTKIWTNSVYSYNPNLTKLISSADNIVNKIIKHYFNINYLEKTSLLKKNFDKKDDLTFNKIIISKSEVKHFNDKVIITIYLFNKKKVLLLKTLNNIYNILTKKLGLINISKINFYNNKSNLSTTNDLNKPFYSDRLNQNKYESSFLGYNSNKKSLVINKKSGYFNNINTLKSNKNLISYFYNLKASLENKVCIFNSININSYIDININKNILNKIIKKEFNLPLHIVKNLNYKSKNLNLLKPSVNNNIIYNKPSYFTKDLLKTINEKLSNYLYLKNKTINSICEFETKNNIKPIYNEKSLKTINIVNLKRSNFYISNYNFLNKYNLFLFNKNDSLFNFFNTNNISGKNRSNLMFNMKNLYNIYNFYKTINFSNSNKILTKLLYTYKILDKSNKKVLVTSDVKGRKNNIPLIKKVINNNLIDNSLIIKKFFNKYKNIFIKKNNELLSKDNYNIYTNSILNNYKVNYLKEFLSMELQYMYYLQMLSFNNIIFKNWFLYPLKKIISKIYNKKVEFNFVNLKYVYLNSDIFTNALSMKLKRNKANLVLDRAINAVPLSKLNYVAFDINSSLNKYVTSHFSRSFLLPGKLFNGNKVYYKNHFDKKLNIDKLNIFQSNSINFLKYKSVFGVRFEAVGRLSKRTTASKSSYVFNSKGTLKTVTPLNYINSSLLVKNNNLVNIQYTKINSKTRNGSFGIKGWTNNV